MWPTASSGRGAAGTASRVVRTCAIGQLRVMGGFEFVDTAAELGCGMEKCAISIKAAWCRAWQATVQPRSARFVCAVLRAVVGKLSEQKLAPSVRWKALAAERRSDVGSRVTLAQVVRPALQPKAVRAHIGATTYMASKPGA